MKLKHLRYRLNITQNEVANALGIRQSHVSLWENGTYRPSKVYLNELNLLFAKELEAYRIDKFTKLDF